MRRSVCRWMLTLTFGAVGMSCATSTAAGQLPGGSADARKLTNPVPMTPQSINAGRQAFQKNCRSCHGAEGKGNGTMAPKNSRPSDLTDKQWARGSTDGEIFSVVLEGAGPRFAMKGYKGRMTETEIWSVVHYIRSLGPKGTR